jgi:hypothetical protein
MKLWARGEGEIPKCALCRVEHPDPDGDTQEMLELASPGASQDTEDSPSPDAGGAAGDTAAGAPTLSLSTVDFVLSCVCLAGADGAGAGAADAAVAAAAAGASTDSDYEDDGEICCENCGEWGEACTCNGPATITPWIMR